MAATATTKTTAADRLAKALAENPESSTTDLMEISGVGRSTVYAQLAKWEAEGKAQRGPAADGRGQVWTMVGQAPKVAEAEVPAQAETPAAETVEAPAEQVAEAPAAEQAEAPKAPKSAARPGGTTVTIDKLQALRVRILRAKSGATISRLNTREQKWAGLLAEQGTEVPAWPTI